MKQLPAFVFLIFILSCKQSDDFQLDRAYLDRYEQSIASLEKKSMLYRSLVGLFKLDPTSANQFGSDQGNDFILDLEGFPGSVGSIKFYNDSLIFRASDKVSVKTDEGVAITDYYLTIDGRGNSPRLHYNHFAWYVSKVGGLVFLKVIDTDHMVENYKTFEKFAPTSEYIFKGSLNYFEQPKMLEVPTILDIEQELRFEGEISFEYMEELHTLQFEESGIIRFGDLTSGEETYGAGRYLFIEPSEDNSVIVDFNLAINPPCTYSSFTTCAFAPRENWLPFKVLAGEKYE